MRATPEAARDILVALDVRRARQLWAVVAPQVPMPEDDAGVLMMLHHARTQCDALPFKLRAYSHRWLTERSLPTGLPDELKPRAERLYPRIVTAVGVAVESLSPAGRPAAKELERAMSDAVAECYADGVIDIDVIRRRMAEARDRLLN